MQPIKKFYLEHGSGGGAGNIVAGPFPTVKEALAAVRGLHIDPRHVWVSISKEAD
jgi:hypothetical protein